jgi:nicotinate-nucleotide pyrophosphorylase (carboxylating)
VIPEYVNDHDLDKIILNTIHEDIGDGDHSALAVIPENKTGRAVLIAKEKGIIAGLPLAEKIFMNFDPSLQINFFCQDGDRVKSNEIIFEVYGRVRPILSAERIVLNFLQRMSGIATFTASLVEKIRTTGVQLLDTRKTTPNLRIIEKWAVATGGGRNHRMGLFDMIMLKDNHIDFAGGITKAISAARSYLEKTGKDLKIEVEVRNLEEVREALSTEGCDIIMLDNMSTEDMKKAVGMIRGKCITEASGNIVEKNIAEIAACGVDYISVGALTHSVKSLDLSIRTKI